LIQALPFDGPPCNDEVVQNGVQRRFYEQISRDDIARLGSDGGSCWTKLLHCSNTWLTTDNP